MQPRPGSQHAPRICGWRSHPGGSRRTFSEGLVGARSALSMGRADVGGVARESRNYRSVRAEIRIFADARLERTLEVGQRTVLVPISTAWVVLPIEPPMDA